MSDEIDALCLLLFVSHFVDSSIFISNNTIDWNLNDKGSTDWNLNDIFHIMDIQYEGSKKFNEVRFD
jgi:hypothetical protein